MAKRRMKDVLVGQPKRALGAAALPGATLGALALNEAFEGAHRVQEKVLARRERAHAEETTRAKIRTRKTQAADVEGFLRGALRARAKGRK